MASICKVGRDPQIPLMEEGVDGLTRLGGTDGVRTVMRLTGTEIGRAHGVLDVGLVEDVREHPVVAVKQAAMAVSDVLPACATNREG